MSFDDPIENASSGAVKGFLDWTLDQIKSLVLKLKDKKLAFIQDIATIDIAKESYNSGERKFYNKYLHKNEFLFLISMGLTLRKLENDKERMTNLPTLDKK